MTEDPAPVPESKSRGGVPAGNWVVLGMFLFALVMIALLWTYWELYTRPFRPLQYAIAEAFPGSSPRVIGGRYKSHKEGNPSVLRIIVWIPTDDFDAKTEEDFDPSSNPGRSQVRALELARIARETFPIEQYDQLDVHLIQRVPEQDPHKWETSHSISQWLEMLDEPQQPSPTDQTAP